jgi:N-acetylneuraminic acid mutarotase
VAARQLPGRPPGALAAGLGLGAALALLLGACGSSSPAARTRKTSAAPASATRASTRPVKLHVAGTATLPAAVQLPAVAPTARGAIAVGGLDAGDSSVAGVVLIEGASTRVVAQLPSALHDAAAATIDGKTYMFGGGEPGGTSASIFRVGASGVQVAGRLPVGASDIAAVTVGSTAYVVGGYTTSAPLRTIVAFTPTGGAHVVATIPRPLRYAAVAAVAGHVLIAGGTSGETAQRTILSFDPATATVRRIGELPAATTHAAGASLNGWFYVLGGRGEGLSDQRSSILAVDPRSGTVHEAGRLPEALSDIGAASLPGRVLAVGGRTSAGSVSDRALTLTPVAR